MPAPPRCPNCGKAVNVHKGNKSCKHCGTATVQTPNGPHVIEGK